MRQSSIYRRLLGSVLVTQLALTVAVVALATYLTERQLRYAFDAALHGRAMSVAALVRFSEEAKSTLIFDRDLVPPPLDKKHPDLYKIFSNDGRLSAASSNWPVNLGEPNLKKRALTINGSAYRVIRLDSVPILDREGPDSTSATTLTVMYGAPTEELEESEWQAAGLVILGSLIFLGLATVLAIWAIRKGLTPLAALAASAARVSPSNWNLEPPPDATETAELAPLTRTMSTMLTTLHQAFTSQRAFIADAAHELKTPVAVLKSTLQSLLQMRRSADEYRAGLNGALEDVERLEKLIHSMLRLARAEQWQVRSRREGLADVDIYSTCEESVERLRALAQQRNIKFDLRNGDEPKIKAEAEDLELIWTNLLENAIQYSPDGAAVQITVAQTDSQARVEIRDWGTGIAESEVSKIFARFHRADASRARETGGYGLGLAIAKAMAEAYRGTISVESRLGAGTTMTVNLPLD
jgi:signal transduction histidine kinase